MRHDQHSSVHSVDAEVCQKAHDAVRSDLAGRIRVRWVWNECSELKHFLNNYVSSNKLATMPIDENKDIPFAYSSKVARTVVGDFFLGIAI